MNAIKTFFQLRTVGLFVAMSLPNGAFAGTGLPGVNNFQKVDDHVYRGAQPTETGFRNLVRLGIRTVIDLRESGGARSASEAASVGAAGMRYISVPMRGMESPSDESVARVLAVLDDTATGPVFVHCHRGADRTGAVIACYRIEHDHWTNDRALAEARSMGMSWYQRALQRYVRSYRPQEAGAAPGP
jgi:uncharacterized protein (TIGR01244 family)